MADDSNNQTPPDSQQSTVTVDTKQLAEIVNAAVTSHLKRNETKQAESFKTLIAEALKGFQPPAPQTDTEEVIGKKSKVDPQITALNAKVEELTKAAQAAQAAAAAAEKKSREDRAFNALRNELATKVRPDVVDGLAKMLYHGESRVELDEQGNPFFKVRRPAGGITGMPEEDALMPIDAGVEYYLKSKEASAFLPAPSPTPPTARTSGSRFPSFNQNPKSGLPQYDKEATTDEEKVRRAMEAEAYYDNLLKNQ